MNNNTVVGMKVEALHTNGAMELEGTVEYVRGEWLGVRQANGRLDEWPAARCVFLA